MIEYSCLQMRDYTFVMNMPDGLPDFIMRGLRAQAAVNFELAAPELRGLGIALARLPASKK